MIIKDLNKKSFEFNGETLYFELNKYTVNNQISIQVISEVDGPYAKLTVCIPGTQLKENQVLIKVWRENEEITDSLRTSGFFIDTGERVPAGYEEAEVWEIV